MSILSAGVIAEQLKVLPEWKHENGAIVRHYEFKDFVGSMLFVNRVAAQAEAAEHHPDIDIRYNKVTLSLVSHDQGGITDRDLSMASAINRLN